MYKENIKEVLEDVLRVVGEDQYRMIEENATLPAFASNVSRTLRFATPRGTVELEWEIEDDGSYIKQSSQQDTHPCYIPAIGEECFIKYHTPMGDTWRPVQVRYDGEHYAVFVYTDGATDEPHEVVVKREDVEFKPFKKSMDDYFNEVHLDYAGYDMDIEVSDFLHYMNDHNMIKDPSVWHGSDEPYLANQNEL